MDSNSASATATYILLSTYRTAFFHSVNVFFACIVSLLLVLFCFVFGEVERGMKLFLVIFNRTKEFAVSPKHDTQSAWNKIQAITLMLATSRNHFERSLSRGNQSPIRSHVARACENSLLANCQLLFDCLRLPPVDSVMIIHNTPRSISHRDELSRLLTDPSESAECTVTGYGRNSGVDI